jgi:hypothetical protein
MWPRTFAERLESWKQLRDQVASADTESALLAINSWWFQAPWRAYHLHWDDQPSWPDPWQLLSDDIYCPLARGLGILYTITLLDRTDIDSAELVLSKNGHNLVQVDKSKYILNWDKSTIVNISPAVKIVKKLTQLQVNEKYR